MSGRTFYQPETVEEACNLLEAHPDAIIAAGSQSLTPLLRADMIDPDSFIDVSRIEEMAGIDIGDAELRLGAGTIWKDINESDALAEVAPAIQTLAGEIGDVQVRNRGTIGGSLAHADPAADMGALLLCYDTEVTCESTAGSRTVPLEEFFFGMFMTDLKEEELLTSVQIARPNAPFAGAYEKFEIRQGGFSTVGVGATVELSPHGDQFESITVGLANCADMPIAVDVAADVVAGEPVDSDTVFEEIANLVEETADPIGDEYASAEYKQRVAGRLAMQCVRTAVTRAQEETQ